MNHSSIFVAWKYVNAKSFICYTIGNMFRGNLSFMYSMVCYLEFTQSHSYGLMDLWIFCFLFLSMLLFLIYHIPCVHAL